MSQTNVLYLDKTNGNEGLDGLSSTFALKGYLLRDEYKFKFISFESFYKTELFTHSLTRYHDIYGHVVTVLNVILCCFKI